MGTKMEIDKEEIEAAIRKLEDESSARPDDPVIWNNLGVNRAILGCQEKAIKSYENAIACAPDYELARNNLSASLMAIGNKYASTKEWDEASRFYGLAIPSASGDVLAALHYNLGIIQFHQKEWQGAIRSFNISRKYGSGNHREALINLGAAKSANGNQHWALEDYQEAESMGPDDPDLLNNIGVTHARLAETENTERSMTTAMTYFARSLMLKSDLEIAVENSRICEAEIKIYQESLAQNLECTTAPESDDYSGPQKVSDLDVETFLQGLGPIPPDPYIQLKLAESTFQNQDGQVWFHTAAQAYANAAELLLEAILLPKVKENSLMEGYVRKAYNNTLGDYADILHRILNNEEIELSNKMFGHRNDIRRLIKLIYAMSSSSGGRPMAHGVTENQPVKADANRKIVLGRFASADADEGILELLFKLA